MATKPDIDAVVALAEAETGICGGKTRLRVCVKPVKHRPRTWTEEENQFVRASLGRLSEDEIGRKLGRSKTSVHIHVTRELHLCAPSKSPTLLTGEHISIGLGADGKTVRKLIDRGIMPGRRLPGGRVIRVVDRLVFLRWASNPMNWVYFKPERVGMLRRRGKMVLGGVYDFAFWEDARKLVRAARRKWKDEWLTPGEVARRLRVNATGTRYVNAAIRIGTLKATRWGNWWILKSDLPKRGGTINFRGKLVVWQAGRYVPVKSAREIDKTALAA